MRKVSSSIKLKPQRHRHREIATKELRQLSMIILVAIVCGIYEVSLIICDIYEVSLIILLFKQSWKIKKRDYPVGKNR